VNWGLVCSPQGRPVAIQVHPGNTSDPDTIPGVLDAVRERFGIDRVILVGDRAMITQAHAQTLKEQGEGFVSALKNLQIKSLVNDGDLQLSLFDQTNIAEITSPRFPGERLVVCRNPLLQAERKRKREELLAATETQLEKIKRMVRGPRGSLRDADAGTIGKRVGKDINKHNMAKHFTLTIADGTFAYERKTEQITQEAALDGIYVLRTTCPVEELSTQAVVRVYKQLKMAERAYRTIKSTLDVRPIRHHLQDRVESHFFLFLLAYYIPVRTERTTHTDALQRRDPDQPDRPRRPRPTLPHRAREDPDAPHPRRRPGLQPPRSDRRARHDHPQRHPDRQQHQHLQADDGPDHDPGQSPRAAGPQAGIVARLTPPRNTRIARKHRRFGVSAPKTSV
jgi:transposase